MRVVACVLKRPKAVCFLEGSKKLNSKTFADRCIRFQALFSIWFQENVGATWLYNRVQFYTTKQIIDKVEQDSLYHFDYKISESDLYFFTQNKSIKVVDFDPFVIYFKTTRYSTNLNHRSQMTQISTVPSFTLEYYRKATLIGTRRKSSRFARKYNKIRCIDDTCSYV